MLCCVMLTLLLLYEADKNKNKNPLKTKQNINYCIRWVFKA